MKAKKNLQDLPYREKLLKLARLYSIEEIQKKISNSRLTNKQIESLLKKNNVLVLEFDNYGILARKEFYNKKLPGNTLRENYRFSGEKVAIFAESVLHFRGK